MSIYLQLQGFLKPVSEDEENALYEEFGEDHDEHGEHGEHDDHDEYGEIEDDTEAEFAKYGKHKILGKYD